MSHTNDTVCLTVVAFLVRDKKVLLCNHPKYDAWLPVGGHIDSGEDPDEALYREIKEETGLEKFSVYIFNNAPDIPIENESKRISLLTPAFVDRHNVGERDHVAFVYFGKVTDASEALKSSEHKELKWFSAKDLENKIENFKPDIVWYALQALTQEGKGQ